MIIFRFIKASISHFYWLMLAFISMGSVSYAQLKNNTWLIGYNGWVDRAKIEFTSSNYTLTIGQRKMGFEGTEATISDDNGNLLLSSNGGWIANSLGDTMLNGSALNSGTNGLNQSLVAPFANMILPFPNDTNKFVLFHHTTNFNGYSYPSYDLFYSIIDITLDGGKGSVISKNDTALSDTLNWGIAACQHSNGRDWWVVMQKHDSNIIYKLLFTPLGIASIVTQQLNVPKAWYNVTQPTFSPDGKKFAYSLYEINSDTTDVFSSLIVCDFDRCSGQFSNELVFPIEQSRYLWGVAFSPNSQLVYTTTTIKVIQINLNNLFVDTVAFYDGFISPPNLSCCQSTFFSTYLATNGKIYITSGNGVQHLHEINYPDSVGVVCDVQQHAVNLGVWSFHAVPNHPNYYLGCDTSQTTCPCLTGIEDFSHHNFKFSVSPNPVTQQQLQIVYLLPQNQKGVFEIFDVNGSVVYSQPLPQWSTTQTILLPKLVNGIYNCVITSGNFRASKKLVLISSE